eukprot:766615-Hanusia_phi.AAC.3
MSRTMNMKRCAGREDKDREDGGDRDREDEGREDREDNDRLDDHVVRNARRKRQRIQQSGKEKTIVNQNIDRKCRRDIDRVRNKRGEKRRESWQALFSTTSF